MTGRAAAPRPPFPRSAALLALGIGLVVAALYRPALSFDFVNLDDPVYVAGNPVLAAPDAPAAARRAFAAPHAQFYIPLTWLSLYADLRLQGGAARGFHRTNLLLFALDAALFFAVLRRWTGATGRSAAAALLFACHPLRVESVAWVTERKDVLALLLALLALGAWLRFLRGRREPWRAGAAALLLLALLAKPAPVVLPALLLLLDFWPLGRYRAVRGRADALRAFALLVREKAVLLAAGALFVALTLGTQSYPALPAGAAARLGNLERGLTAPWIHLRNTAWPAALAPRNVQPATGFDPAALALFAGLAAGSVWLALRLRAKAPALGVGWLWYLVALAPVSGLVNTGSHWIEDRFTLLPHLGLAAGLVWTCAGSAPVAARPASRRAAAGALALVLVALALATRAQLPFWRDGDSLMRRAVLVSPRDPQFRRILAHRLLGEGAYAEAARHFRTLTGLEPGRAEDWFNLGLAAAGAGDGAGAREAYREALRLDPGDLEARFNLAELLGSSGDAAGARRELEAIARAAPDSAEGAFARGRLLEGAGRGAQAREQYGLALTLPARLPRSPDAFRRALGAAGARP